MATISTTIHVAITACTSSGKLCRGLHSVDVAWPASSWSLWDQDKLEPNAETWTWWDRMVLWTNSNHNINSPTNSSKSSNLRSRHSQGKPNRWVVDQALHQLQPHISLHRVPYPKVSDLLWMRVNQLHRCGWHLPLDRTPHSEWTLLTRSATFTLSYCQCNLSQSIIS